MRFVLSFPTGLRPAGGFRSGVHHGWVEHFLDRDLSVGLRAFYLQDDRTDQSSFWCALDSVTPATVSEG